MRSMLQRISGALMVPIVILPLAAIFMALGQISGAKIISAAGASIVITNLPLLFAIGVAIGFTKYEGMAGFAAVVGYVVFTGVIAAIDPAVNTGVLGGILIGIITSVLFDRYHTLKLPEYLGLFSGKRFIPIASALAGLALGIVMGYIWPPVGRAIDLLGRWMYAAGGIGVFSYGLINRLLIPTGLHHILQNIIMYIIGTFHGQSGEFARFFAGDPNAGRIVSGWVIVMGFGLPAACLAMVHEAKPENRKRAAGILITAALTSIVTGITEPIEFSFMFAAPLLYAVHALLTGVALFVTYTLGIRHVGEAVPQILMHWPFATKPWLLFPVGLVFAVAYYGLFRFLIRTFNLPTLGRGDMPVEGLAAGQETVGRAKRIVAALGGRENIISVDACMSRLRLVVRDSTLVQDKALKKLGAAGVSRFGQGNVQVVFGSQSEAIRNEIKVLLDPCGEEETLCLVAPISGKTVPLSQVPDDVFAQKLVGVGLAIDPMEGLLVAPADGEITTVFPGGHAIGLNTPEGLEIILHIGLDTVRLKGEGFLPLVNAGEKVAIGQPLCRFDLQVITAHNLSLVSPMVITNLPPDRELEITHAREVTAGKDMVMVIRRKG